MLSLVYGFLFHSRIIAFSSNSVMVAQIPEAISFAFIAGIDPFIALQTTWIMNIVTSLIGGRPGLLSSVSGLGAIVIRMLVKHHGEQYIWYSVILSGFLQVIFSSLRLGKYLRIMPPAITIGLLNAVCLLTYALQLRYFKEIPTEETTVVDEDNLNMPWAYFYGYDLPWLTSLSEIIVLCCEALVALMICFLMPRFITVFPSTLVALVVVTAVHVGITMSTNYTSPDIDDYCTTEVCGRRIYKLSYLLVLQQQQNLTFASVCLCIFVPSFRQTDTTKEFSSPANLSSLLFSLGTPF